jgi:hypothetical protein
MHLTDIRKTNNNGLSIRYSLCSLCARERKLSYYVLYILKLDPGKLKRWRTWGIQRGRGTS